ncbi:MAG: tetratricopeptide repeat protein [Armatimonadota bacterium]|nr:tetratricopeptide repeat protein [Armatimonadota bacterium]MDR7456121.1 tetratricopeptide repeat protein [Armatimonadota bacterium]
MNSTPYILVAAQVGHAPRQIPADDGTAQAAAETLAAARAVLAGKGGQVIETPASAAVAVFAEAPSALLAALAVERDLADGAAVLCVAIDVVDWPQDPPPDPTELARHALRIARVGHGGQVLLSHAARERVAAHLPEAMDLRDLGEHRLKDLREPQRLFQVRHPDLPAHFPALRSLDHLPNNLPRQLTSFVGREREMARVRELVGRTPLLTLTGPGGGGKTRLALQVAADLIDAFRDGVWLVELASISDGAVVPHAVSAALGAREVPGRPLEVSLVDYLRSRELLLVLDECEHLLDSCARLAEGLLRQCPGLRVLATSREPLHIAGETALVVGPLAVPEAGRAGAGEIARAEAVRLFVDRATAAAPGFVLTDANARWVAEICRRLDGIPLAIELAAARLKMLPVEAIADRLGDRFRLLAGGARTALPRQQTLRATIEWSHALLADRERLLFRRLAVFAGGFTLEAAEAVCAGPDLPAIEVLDLLSRLVDKSLVLGPTPRAPGPARFAMLESIREYAAEALLAAAEVAEVRRRHLGYFLGLAEQAEPLLRTGAQLVWFERLDPERENLRAAVAWGREAPDAHDDVARLACVLWWFWMVRGNASEGREMLAAAIALTPATEGGRVARGRAISGAGLLAWRQRDYAAAAALAEQGAAVSEQAGDPTGLAAALNVLALVARDRGDLDRAEPLHRRSLELWRREGNRWGEALALQNLGYIAHRRGDYDGAQRCCDASLAIFRMLGDRWGVATVLYILGRVALRRGDDDRARALNEEALALFKEIGNHELFAFTTGNLGYLAVRRGEYGRAAALLAEALAAFREAGDRRGVADVLAAQGQMAAAQGDHETARRLYAQSLAANAELSNRQGIAEDLERLAAVAAAGAGHARAARLLAAADALRAEIGVPLPQADRAQVSHLLEEARGALGSQGYEEAWTAGRRMGTRRAVEEALGGPGADRA